MTDLASASSWDLATRYHEFKNKDFVKKNKKIGDQLRFISAQAVLEQAQKVLGSIVRPVDQHLSPWSEVPSQALQTELDLEETIENSPFIADPHHLTTANDLWMSFQTIRSQSVVLAVDTSLSMTGEKLALTAVALAVVLLQFPEEKIGIVAFENEAQILKKPDERISIALLIERFLDVPAQGYTHLESGMRLALTLTQSNGMETSGKPVSTVLLTDGKYTAGKDPAYLAPRFPHLVVLKMGDERASLDLCRELARNGHGSLKEVANLSDLPSVMYSVVKDLLRGR
jgi:hypothetical protein